MGRRALRKTDPQLDLSGYLFPLDQVPQPFRAAEFFAREAPLEIEVGSGKGLFLQNAALRAPDHNFLGIELARKYAAYCAARLARRSVANARMIGGDASRFFREWLPDQCAAAVHVYFPDPWWKKRHVKRRVMNEAFVRQVERVLRLGGKLHFWTDVEEYYLAAVEVLGQCPGLSGPHIVAERTAEHDLDYRTHFERRCRRDQLPVFRSEFSRRDTKGS